MSTTDRDTRLVNVSNFTRKKSTPLTVEQRQAAQHAFLEYFSKTANITQSCKAAGIVRNTFRQWCEHDKAFSAAYEDADLAVQDMLIEAAKIRAVDGVPRSVISLGKAIRNDDGTIMTEREYSDALLIRLMSWRIPGFRESKDAGTTVNIDVHGAKDSLLERLASSIRVVEADSPVPSDESDLGQSGESSGEEPG